MNHFTDREFRGKNNATESLSAIWMLPMTRTIISFPSDPQVPVLVVGTKALQKTERRGLTIADFCGAEQLLIDSFSEANSGLAPGSSNAVKLSYFFDKVIEKRYFSKNVQSPPQAFFGDRRRPATSPRYLQHLD